MRRWRGGSLRFHLHIGNVGGRCLCSDIPTEDVESKAAFPQGGNDSINLSFGVRYFSSGYNPLGDRTVLV